MTAATALRVLAIGLVVGGLIDPARTVSRRLVVMVDVAVPRATGSAEPATTTASAALARALTAALGDDAAVRTRGYADGEPLPCASDVACVVVTDPGVVPRGGMSEREQPLFTVAPATQAETAVAIDEVSLTPAHVDEQAVAVVTVTGRAPAGRETVIDVRDGDIPAGSAVHTWTDASPVTVRVPWWPARSGRRTLTVTACTGGEAAAAAVTALVDVAADPLPVLVIDARPSWAVTFVRRALDADTRLAVDTVSGLAPGLAAGRGRAVVDDARVAQARVVVLGGLDALTASDVGRYRRVMVSRGGAVVLVPDAAVTGAATGLLPGQWRRRLDSVPSDAGGLRASEWLLASDLADGDEVLAAHAGQPAIVSRPMGEGRLVVVGALDAWRQRAFVPPGGEASDPTAVTPFARAWQDLVTGLARGTAPPVDVQVTAAPGDDEAVVDVQGRTMQPVTSWSASAQVVCGQDAQVLRLMPQARAGHFRGRARLPRSGAACEIVAAITGVGEARATLALPSRTPAYGRRVIARLRQLATDSGGLAAEPDDVAGVHAAIAALRPSAAMAGTAYPARHWLWGVATALALGAEWWLRRRAGQR